MSVVGDDLLMVAHWIGNPYIVFHLRSAADRTGDEVVKF